MIKRLEIYHPKIDLKETIQFISDYRFERIKTKYITDGWSGLSLRGYGKSIHDLLKPNVLGSNVPTTLTDTILMNGCGFKPIVKVLNQIPSTFERVRFMKLMPKTTIPKHTDKIDKDFVNGKIARFHIPLKNNPNVEYYYWDKGVKKTETLKTANYYYFDVRFPHSVRNNGDEDRINLVVDVFVNKDIENLIGKGESGCQII